MITIPQINYITYILPLDFPPLLVKRFNKAVDTFLCAGKRSLFNRTKVYAAKEDGGLSLLKVDWYHYTFSFSQLSKIIFFRRYSSRMDPYWGGTYWTFPNTGFHITGGEIPFKNPLLEFARETWKVSHQVAGLKPSSNKRAHLLHNRLLKVGKKTTIYWKSCVKAGIVFIKDVFEGNVFMFFEQILAKHKIPKKGLKELSSINKL